MATREQAGPARTAPSGAREAAAPSRRRRARLLRVAELLVVPAIGLLGWQVAAVVIGSVAVASPAATVRAAAAGIADGWLIAALLHTIQATLVATAVAAAAGLWLGFALGMSRYWGRVLEDPLLWVYSIPKVTLFPVFLLTLGLTMSAEVAFGAFHGVFPLTLFLLNAIRATPPVYFKVARAYRLGRWKTFTRIIVPETVPSMVTGLRYCFSLTFLGVILAEMFAARAGAGYELVQAIGLHRVARVFAIALVLVLLALAVNGLFLACQHRVTRHRDTTGDGVAAY